MKIDFIHSPESIGRYAVIDAATGEEIVGVALADDEAGTYATFVTRPRKLSDPPGADLRVRNPDGSFALRERRGEIEIVDVTVSPFKAEFLALLDDQDVADKLVEVVLSRVVICGPVVNRKVVAAEVERVLGRMAAARV